MNHTTAIINLSEWFKPLGKLYFEMKIGDLYSDLLLEYEDKLIAIEYQNSYRNRNYIIGKLTEYSRMNVYCSWIFNTKLLGHKQVKEAFTNYGFIYHYTPKTNQLWRNEKEIIPQQIDEEAIYNDIKIFPDNYKNHLVAAAKKLELPLEIDELSSEILTPEQHDIIDVAIAEIKKEKLGIDLRFETKPYLDTGLKLAHF
jgi:competence CoiA-like predicted nuclease